MVVSSWYCDRSAARDGHLRVVKWLRANLKEVNLDGAMDASANGHLDIVQWLDVNATATCITEAMNLAAEKGHLEVLMWLYIIRTEGCTVKAIESAVNNNHIQVARTPHVFEVLLFLHASSPKLFTAEFIEEITRGVLGPELYQHCKVAGREVSGDVFAYVKLNLMQLLMLTCVEIVLRCNPAAGDLEHNTRLISNFLGPSPNLSLSDAYTFGSVKLLDWIWESSCVVCPTDRSPRWTLCNYLRSDPHYYQYQFIKSLRVAAGRGNLKVVRWLFMHFSDCNLVPVTVVEDAAKNGHLPVLQFLLVHDTERYNRQEQCQAKKMKVGSNINKVEPFSVPGCAEQCGHTKMVVQWGRFDMKDAIQNGHFKVARWLFEDTPHANCERDIGDIITLAMSVGEIELAEFLLPEDRCIVDYTSECPCPEVIEWMLDSGHLQLNVDRAASAIMDLACGGHLDLMKRVAQLHSSGSALNAHWFECWYDAMGAACKLGHLPMLQWLIEHPSGWEVCRRMQQKNPIDYLLVIAAENGHVHLLPYIHKHGGSDGRYPLQYAARNGQLGSVRWLLEYIPYAKRLAYRAIAEAAKYGQLEVLQFVHGLDSKDAPGSKRIRNGVVNAWWPETYSVMNTAARGGHLAVVKWIHSNRPEGCTGKAFEFAASNGDLEMIQWLHTNTRVKCTPKAIDCAAQQGHLQIVKWICANHSECCTANTLKQALINGHLPVVGWIQTHFPQLALTRAFISRCPSNVFEVMLFMHAHYPHFITPTFVKTLAPFLRRSSMMEGKAHTLEWLLERENWSFPHDLNCRAPVS